MAGRPLSAFKRVNSYSERIAALHQEMEGAMPAMYRERPGPSGTIGMAWHEAVESTAEAWRAIHGLVTLMAERAGVDQLGPGSKADDDPPMGDEDNPHPAHFTEETFVEIDGETATLRDWARIYDNPVELVLGRIRSGLNPEWSVIAPIDVECDTVD